MMRQVSCPVRRGAGRKGRKDLARSLPSFKVLAVLFLAYVSHVFCLQSRHVGYTHFSTFEFANSIRAFFACLLSEPSADLQKASTLPCIPCIRGAKLERVRE
jgi:hypothetical protein